MKIAAAIAFLLAAALPAAGERSSRALDLGNISSVQILGGWQEQDGTHVAAIHFDLEPGWKTYWRAPDSTGIPPEFDWTGSVNVASVAYHWPTPQLFTDYGVTTVGYADDLILPIVITPARPSDPVTLRLRTTYGVCKDVCVPRTSRTSARIGGAPANEALIRAALAARPRAAARMGLVAAHCRIEALGDDFRVSATLRFAPALDNLHGVLMEAGSDMIWIASTRYQSSGGDISVTAELHHYGEAPLSLSREALRWTLLTGNGGVDVQGCSG